MIAAQPEEQYDILDDNGHPTGEILPKSVVHERELRHGSVLIWIYNNKGEVLVQRRAKDKKCFPDVWDVSVAGHISAGDTPLETAVREIEEEIGLIVSVEDLVQVDLTTDIVPWLPDKTHPECCWVYILHKELDPTQLTIQQSELHAVKLQSMQAIQAQRKKPDSDKVFAARNPRIYDIAFEEIATRTTRHAHASGVIFEDDNGNVLVLRRHAASPEGNTWGLVGGNIDPGEDKLTAAIREVSEEINHSVVPDDLAFLKTYHWVRPGLDLTFEVYKYVVSQDAVAIELDTTENTEHMWASPQELLQRDDLMVGLYPILEDAYGKAA